MLGKNVSKDIPIPNGGGEKGDVHPMGSIESATKNPPEKNNQIQGSFFAGTHGSPTGPTCRKRFAPNPAAPATPHGPGGSSSQGVVSS